jgi:hypothetical protein
MCNSRHVALAFLVSLLFAAIAQAQCGTVISGTITDPSGIPWAGGTIQGTLSLPVGASGATCNGAQIAGNTPRVTLDSTGSFLMQVPDSGLLRPLGTSWTFSINISPGVPPPQGKGPQTFSATTPIICSTNTPATCTAGAMNITAALVPVPSLTFAVTGVTSLTSNALDLAQPPYSLKTALFVPDATSTNTSCTVTCPNADCNFTTTAAVGNKVYGICSGAGTPQCPPVGTIAAINGAQSINVSSCSTSTVVANVTLVWGSDSTTSLQAADTVFQAAPVCMAVHFPAGYYLCNAPVFNTVPASCNKQFFGGNGTIGEGAGPTFVGRGRFTTYLVMTPDSTFRGPTGQFFSMTGSLSLHLQDFSVTGMGWGCNGVTTGNTALLKLPQNSFVERLGLINLCTHPVDQFIALQPAGPGYYQSDTIIDGVGTTGLNVIGQCCNNVYGGWIDNIGAAGAALAVTGGNGIGGGFVFTHGMQLGQGGIGNTVTVNGTWFSQNDQISSAGNGTACIDARSNGVFIYLDGDVVNCNANSQYGVIMDANTPTVVLKNTYLAGGTNGFANGTTGTIVDNGGNTFVGPNLFTGTYIGATNSFTATKCATGNFALTSGWGASSITSVANNGNILGCHVTIAGAAGAAGPVLTWTYPAALQFAPGSCHLSGPSGTLTGVSTGTPGTSTVAYTFTGTPSAQTYVFDVGCP